MDTPDTVRTRPSQLSSKHTLLRVTHGNWRPALADRDAPLISVAPALPPAFPDFPPLPDMLIESELKSEVSELSVEGGDGSRNVDWQARRSSPALYPPPML